ncbi:amidohydrolase [Streptomyces sp. LE64]|uniref:amidohydrolase n=1 Tax=Streptomyces sp. LE64 TaxID=3448653 RepID=UPI0040430F83
MQSRPRPGDPTAAPTPTATEAAARTVLAGLDDTLRSDLEALYRDLHRHPEVGHQEVRTAALIAARLRAQGLETTEHIGTTGVTGVLHNGEGPTVLLRADMDALPVAEATGLPYASEHRGVMHACGHDVHLTCLLGLTDLMSTHRGVWRGTLIALFQPAEERGDGARTMIADGLRQRVPQPDVALAQHVTPLPAGQVRTRSGPFMATADSLRVTLHGRGTHGSTPDLGVDPVVLAAMIVVRLQTVVSRELSAATRAVVTVGSIHAGTGPNIIPDTAELQINVRTHDERARAHVLDAIGRIVRAECEASGSPRPPEVERTAAFPPTVNDDDTTSRVAAAFSAHFGDAAGTMEALPASEDFSEIPRAFGVPYTYWCIGGTAPDRYAEADAAGTVATTVPGNHSPQFAPVLQPTLDTGVRALLVAALAWLASPAHPADAPAEP